MDLDAIRCRVEEAIEGAEVTVTCDGYYVNVAAVSPLFEGMNAVKRQQMVYAGLSQMIADGSLHAVNIKTQTPEEAL